MLSLCTGVLGSFGGAGQLGVGGMGFNNDDMAARLQQQTMQMQQVCISWLLQSWCLKPASDHPIYIKKYRSIDKQISLLCCVLCSKCSFGISNRCS